MALWQCGFFIIPANKSSIIKQEAIDENHCFDDSKYWDGHKLPCSFFDTIEDVLPKSTSWNKNLKSYGDENSNRLEVLCEANMIVSVSFRIDFTEKYELLLNRLIETCILNGLIILDENLNSMNLNFLFIKNTIESSLQFQRYRNLYS